MYSSDTMHRIIRSALLIALVSFASCTTSHAQQGARYRVASIAVLSLDRVGGDMPLVDTLVTAALLEITITNTSPSVATLAIDSLQVTSSGMVRRAPDAFVRGRSVAAVLTDGRPRITGDSLTSCTAERPLAALLPELLPLLPMPLRADQQWSDTTVGTYCGFKVVITFTVHLVILREFPFRFIATRT